jgi:hypothetical protein
MRILSRRPSVGQVLAQVHSTILAAARVASRARTLNPNTRIQAVLGVYAALGAGAVCLLHLTKCVTTVTIWSGAAATKPDHLTLSGRTLCVGEAAALAQRAGDMLEPSLLNRAGAHCDGGRRD